MEITAKMVKELRDMTGAGMMDCKEALKETNGDMDKAIELLREKGAAKAVKKAGKVAAEGLISMKLSDDNKKGTIVEINSQTDFVAKNEMFIDLTNKVTNHVFNNNIENAEDLANSDFEGQNFTEYLNEQISQIGENIVVRRFDTLEAEENEYIAGYVHFNNTNGVILKAKFDSQETLEGSKKLIQNICMHISAMGPDYISYKELDPTFVEKELAALKGSIEKENEDLEILGKTLKHVPKYGSRSQITDEVIEEETKAMKEELLAEGKPEHILDKIIPGKIAKFFEDNTQIDAQYALLSQAYVLDADKTVEEAIKEKEKELNGTIEIVKYHRYKVGDGIEVVKEDFAAEVAKQMQG